MEIVFARHIKGKLSESEFLEEIRSVQGRPLTLSFENVTRLDISTLLISLMAYKQWKLDEIPFEISSVSETVSREMLHIGFWGAVGGGRCA